MESPITALLALPLLAAVGGYELATQPVGPVTPTVVAGLFYVGVLAAVAAFLFWSIGVRGVGAARLRLPQPYPGLTVVIAVPTLGERAGLAQLVGGLLVICGVTFASSKGRKKPAGGTPPAEAS